jgi:putative hemolysin
LEGDPAASFFIAGLIVSFLLSTFFASIKIMFYSVDKNTISPDDEHLRHYASKVEDVLEDRILLNSTVAFGRTISNVGFAVVCYAYTKIIFSHVSPYKSILFSSLFSVLFLSLFAYVIPRALSLKYYRSYYPLFFVLYRMLSWFFLPFTSLFNMLHKWFLGLLKYDSKLSFLSDEEQARITQPSDTESLDDDEKEMIRSIFDLGETTVDEIMVPRIDMKGIAVETDLTTVLNVIREEGHSRFPVYKETIDSVVGVLYAKDILSWLSENTVDHWNLSELLKKPHYVPVGKKVNDLMQEFKKKHLHIAIVVDEYGGTAGLVTMEDILEEIVGDIQDEYDEEEKEVIQIAENVYIIDPHIDLQDLNEELDINIETEEVEYTTLGGLIYHEYGDVPHENSEFDYNGLKLTVLKMDNQRIEKVKVEVLQRPSKTFDNDEF